MHSEFGLDPGLSYLNHAAVAPWPRRTVDAVHRFATENMTRGSSGYPSWLETEKELKSQLAELINAESADDIALSKSTSESLSIVAHGLPWKPGDSVVSLYEEFPSNRYVWESLSEYGVEARFASIHAENPEQALIDACDRSTRLIAVSSVQYSNGMRLRIERLGEFCKCRGIWLCVDAIQHLGALQFDVRAWNVDFLAADGHKWMLGPEGLAVFYCRPELRGLLRLRQYGWHMVADAGDFENHIWRPADTAARFECGSPNMLGIHALAASIGLIAETDIRKIERKVLDNSRYMKELIERSEWSLAGSEDAERRSGIVAFRVPGHPSEKLHHVLRENGVACAVRAGNIRFSPHFYTPREDIDRAFSLLASETA